MAWVLKKFKNTVTNEIPYKRILALPDFIIKDDEILTKKKTQLIDF
ncbi:MAG: hypothetical protein IPN86_17540 [Saprospiraceae bacterium]|nr:hypothetical protein [Saprospiraceae bacterium]